MKKVLTICTVVMVLFAVPAMASYSVTHTHSQGTGYANISFNGGGSTTSSYLGRFILQSQALDSAGYPTYTVSTVDGPEAYSFYSYCLEPLQSIGVGHSATYDFEVAALAGTDGISTSEAAWITELFGRYNPLLSGNPMGSYTGGSFRTAAAALQLAIWEINLDATWNLSNGNMIVLGTIQETGASKTVNQVAADMLASLDGTGPMASNLEALRNGGVQDLIIQTPEPATMALLALGGMLLRRKK